MIVTLGRAGAMLVVLGLSSILAMAEDGERQNLFGGWNGERANLADRGYTF